MSTAATAQRGTKTASSKSRSNPVVFHGLMALIVAVVCAVTGWAVFSRQWQWQPWLFSWIAAINLTAFAYYAHDKSRAKRSKDRVPEVVLYGLALAGGSVGAYAGMYLFRHKTIKGRFQLVYWTIVIVQMGLVATLIRYFFFGNGSGGS